MIWPAPPDDYPFDDAFRSGPSYREERLRHLVFLDGLLVDTWTEQAQGTAYWDRAQELDRVARPRSYVPDPPPTPPYERILEWLDSVVGGRAAVLAMDDTPLPAVEVPGSGEHRAEVVALLERVCRDYFDDEFLNATCAALASLALMEPKALEGFAGEVAGALCWLVGRANGRVGAGTAVTQQVLKRELWAKNGISSRATRFRHRLRELKPPSPPFRPSSCPNLLELGNAAFLTSETRRDLILLRDRALAAASAAVADEKARQASQPAEVVT